MKDSLWNFIIFGVLGINSCFWVNFLPSSPLTRLSFSFQHFQQGGGPIFWLSDEVQKYESSPNSLLAHFQPSSVMEPLERIFYHFNIDSGGFFWKRHLWGVTHFYQQKRNKTWTGNLNEWPPSKLSANSPIEDVLGGGVLLQLLHRGQAIVGRRAAAVALAERWEGQALRSSLDHNYQEQSLDHYITIIKNKH